MTWFMSFTGISDSEAAEMLAGSDWYVEQVIESLVNVFVEEPFANACELDPSPSPRSSLTHARVSISRNRSFGFND